MLRDCNIFNEITVTGCDILVDVTQGWVNHVHCCLGVIVSCVIQFLWFTDFHMILLKYLIYDAINDVKKRLFMHWSILIKLICNMMGVPTYGPLELLKVPIITMCMPIPFMFWTEVLSWNTHKLQSPICWVAKGRLLLNYFLTENK